MPEGFEVSDKSSGRTVAHSSDGNFFFSQLPLKKMILI